MNSNEKPGSGQATGQETSKKEVVESCNNNTLSTSNCQNIFNSIVNTLGGKILSDGSAMVHCANPAHTDKKPSLHITPAGNKLLVHCKAGCQQQDVIQGLKNLGLWPTNRNSKPIFNKYCTPPGVPGRWYGKPFVRCWTYLKDDGLNIEGYAVRYEKDGDKDVIPFFKKNGSDWKAGAAPVPRPLYNQHLLKQNPEKPVMVHEGEKASDGSQKLLGKHYVPVTWPGGSSAVNKADWSPMKGRDVFVNPDADEPGMEAAHAVVAECRKAGARSVSIINPPKGVKQGWDLADAVDEKWTETETLLWIQANTVQVTNPTVTTVDPRKIKERAEQILRDREPPAPFTMDLMPELIKTYVQEISKRTDADRLIILMAVLSSMSAVIGRRAYIPEGEYFTRLYCNIWSLTQSLSGSFKTTALNKGCRIAWQIEAKLRAKINALKQQKKSEKETPSLKFIEQEIRELQAQSCILPNRMSCEGLLELLAAGQAGLIPLSEFGVWLDSMQKSHNTGMKPLFTDLFDVPQQYSYKTKSGGYLIINWPFISICGMSTPEWIQDHISLKDVSTGFFARFLLLCPPSKRNVPLALPVIQEPFNSAIENQITTHLDSLTDDNPFHLVPSAARAFQNVHEAIYSALAQLDEHDQELLAPYAKRWSPYVLKLAIIFQVAIDPEPRKITVEAVQAASTVVEYAIKSTIYLFRGELGMSPFQRDCQRILTYIAKYNGTVDRFRILASRILEGGAKDYDEVLCTLEEQNRIELIPTSSGKKKYEIIRLIQDENKKFE